MHKLDFLFFSFFWQTTCVFLDFWQFVRQINLTNNCFMNSFVIMHAWRHRPSFESFRKKRPATIFVDFFFFLTPADTRDHQREQINCTQQLGFDLLVHRQTPNIALALFNSFWRVI